MATNSLKLPEELKQRAAKAAQELGISTHAFMLDAIRQAADADEVRSYLRKRIGDKQTPRPDAKAWRK
jgi:predicted transcriptional regulator